MFNEAQWLYKPRALLTTQPVVETTTPLTGAALYPADIALQNLFDEMRLYHHLK